MTLVFPLAAGWCSGLSLLGFYVLVAEAVKAFVAANETLDAYRYHSEALIQCHSMRSGLAAPTDFTSVVKRLASYVHKSPIKALTPPTSCRWHRDPKEIKRCGI